MVKQEPKMPTWRIVSWVIRWIVVANLAALTGVLLFHSSRPLAIKVFSGFKLSALALLLLLPIEYLLLRTERSKKNRLVVDSALSMLMFAVWFVIAAATF